MAHQPGPSATVVPSDDFFTTMAIAMTNKQAAVRWGGSYDVWYAYEWSEKDKYHELIV